MSVAGAPARSAGELDAGEDVERENVAGEGWVPAATLIPPSLRQYMARFEQLNPLQAQAVPKVLATHGHIMVVAPTSSGKTLIGEIAALRSIVTEGKPAVWLLPARALAAEIAAITRRWRALGIATIELTGETNMSSEAVRQAQLWVATTEKFEALYRRASLKEFIDRIGCLIIDEVHLVGDATRGATLESLIARVRAAAARTRIVALSATVSNARELAAWIDAELVRSSWRPTSLTTELVPFDAPARGTREAAESAKDAVLLPLLRGLVSSGADAESPHDAERGASAVVFCGSKAAVVRTAAGAAGVPFRGLALETVVESCFRRGVGIHFRDAPGAARALEAFRARRLRVLVATSGLSTGVNTPAKFVIIRDLALGMTPLEVSQAQQMFGRAGRAGHEAEGFGYLLVPRDEHDVWAAKLGQGYEARSRVGARLGDAILAEMLLGSITDRAGARAWFEQTLAFAQRRTAVDLEATVDELVRRGFASETDGVLAVTELGALTSRLMIDVASAGEMLRTLAELPHPTSANEAEELLLQAVAVSARGLRERPVNERAYAGFVDQLLAGWSPLVVARASEWFGARVCMAAAQLALRMPDRAHEQPPLGVSMAEFGRAAEDVPRYLAWVAALGYVDASAWAPAVAGDLPRRLTWWQLTPRPERGSGRLLWMLERMVEPQHQRARMPDLWRRARMAGFAAPEGIDARPRGVDITPQAFTELVGARAGLTLGPLVDLDLHFGAAVSHARVTVVARTDTGQTIATSRSMRAPLSLARPSGRGERLALDAFLYTRDGDFAYAGAMAALPERAVRADPFDDASALIEALPAGPTGLAHPRGVRRLFQGERRRLRHGLGPLIERDARLAPIAAALAGHDATPAATVLAVTRSLRALLRHADRAELRSPRDVLRSGEASEAEVQIALAALLASLEMDAGVAISEGHPVAVVRVNERWMLAGPRHARPGVAEALIPESLPRRIEPVAAAETPAVGSAAPQFAWMPEFTAGAS